jgi:TRAP-type C4-dicarboxylate transport system permease large subunit
LLQGTGFADRLVIILVIVPIASPIIEDFGFDIVWFCAVFLVVLQTAYLTPPMAPSIPACRWHRQTDRGWMVGRTRKTASRRSV